MASEPRPPRRWRTLAVFGLWTVAVAQPLYDLLGVQPAFFLHHRAGPAELILFALAVLLAGPALVLLVATLAGRLAPALGDAVHRAAVALLAAALVLQLLRRGPALGSALPAAVAILVGAVVVWGWSRSDAPRLAGAVLALGAPLALGLFLTAPAARAVRVAATTAPATALPPPPAGAPAWSTPLVVVIFDELSLIDLLDAEGRIDGRHYPAFAALAERATFFRQTTATHYQTTHVLPMLLTGRRDVDPERPTREHYPQNLFTLLEASHRIHASERVTRLAPPAPGNDEPAGLGPLLADAAVVWGHLVLPANVARSRLPPIHHVWGDFRSRRANTAGDDGLAELARRERRVRDFRAVIEQIEPSSPPGLYFVHTLLPHTPWRLLPNGQVYAKSRLRQRHLAELVERAPPLFHLAQYQRHLFQIQLADRLLGEVLARLDERGMLDRALILVTADHGASNRPDGSRRHPSATDHPEDILRVPALLKAPFQREGVIDDHPFSSLDLLPTIADLLGLELTHPVDGHSAFDPARPSPAHHEVAALDGTVHAYPATWPADRGSLDYRLRSFDWSDPIWGLYRFGPFGALVGRPLTSLAPAGDDEPPGDDELTLELDQPDALARYDPRAEWAPARIVGALHGPRPPRAGRHLAIAVNGVVAAVTQTVVLDDTETFAALVPVRTLIPEDNRVAVLVLEGTPERLRSRRVPPRRESAEIGSASGTGPPRRVSTLERR